MQYNAGFLSYIFAYNSLKFFECYTLDAVFYYNTSAKDVENEYYFIK